MKRKKMMIEAQCENILCIFVQFIKYDVNMSYFDWNELICFCVILIVIKIFLKQVSFQEIYFI